MTFRPKGKTVIFPVRLAAGAPLRHARARQTGLDVVRRSSCGIRGLQAERPIGSYTPISTDRRALGRWLAAVRRYGFAVLRDVPRESGTLCKVAELFGYVRETNYGRWFEVRAEVNPNNLAYTNLGLQAHTDNPYRDPVPTMQILACLENSVEGGDSIVVDGFKVGGAAEGGEPARLRSPHALSARASNMPARPACGFAPRGPSSSCRRTAR